MPTTDERSYITDRRIMAAITALCHQHGQLTLADIANYLSMPKSTVYYHIQRLAAAGQIHYEPTKARSIRGI
jgi:predicted ArsR family transcriptional regulator